MLTFRISGAILCLCLLSAPAALFAGKITLNKNYVICCRENATVMEQYAAETLQKYIARSAGLKLKIVSKISSPAIKIALDSALKREEHLVKAFPNGDLLVSGGVPSGVIYGAFEFLEKVIGCRFLAPDAEYVPRMKKISFEDTLLLRGVPAFLWRQLSPGSGVETKLMDLHTKMRFSGMVIKGVYVNPYRHAKVIGHGHSFHWLAKDFPKEKTEYFSLDTQGRRLRSTSTAGPGQLCLTHPDVRDLVSKKLIAIIDRMIKSFNAAPADKR